MTYTSLSKPEEEAEGAEGEKESAPKGTGLLGSLYNHGWKCVQAYWQGKGSIYLNKDLAEGVQQLVAAGFTTTDQLKHPDSGGWWLEGTFSPPVVLALLQALEKSFPGST